jgi:hypothetical protein
MFSAGNRCRLFSNAGWMSKSYTACVSTFDHAMFGHTLNRLVDDGIFLRRNVLDGTMGACMCLSCGPGMGAAQRHAPGEFDKSDLFQRSTQSPIAPRSAWQRFKQGSPRYTLFMLDISWKPQKIICQHSVGTRPDILCTVACSPNFDRCDLILPVTSKERNSSLQLLDDPRY